jgi:hypothetical protein
MMAEHLVFDGISRLDLPAERVLQAAIDARVETVVVLGYDADGEFYFASTKGDGGEVIWLMEIAKKKLLEMTE